MAKTVKRASARPGNGGGRGKEEAGKAPAKPPPGCLLALEGTAGRELARGVRRLSHLWGGKEIPWSRWDASNTFFEIRLGKAKRAVTPLRSLLLLYASDLLFRLRWEIQPALAEGRTVIAAPYVGTAIAFGLASGLPQDWLDELFSFAPKPYASFRLKEKAKPGKASGKGLKSGGDFIEFCSRLLGAHSEAGASDLRAAALGRLEELERQGALLKLRKKLPKGVAKRATS
jgi:hypothetical protein